VGIAIGNISSAAFPVPDKQEQKTIGAAKDFEALLIGQMLKSVRTEGSGWLGSGDSADEDSSNDVALSMGEEQMAKALSAGGGLGLAKMIEANLQPRSSDAPNR
jgi:flagellar protein FlgJ